ncbi:MAG: putative sulfite:cytochrome c oxidoreductase (subunit b) oxidoreductase protein [Verrucomicrobiaceae bacterium]|nr:putative sulfite:cytochrome c oxidoreductase (subunit b) oxidoreductase protein [Verrucomicrobiaceae bacterium]
MKPFLLALALSFCFVWSARSTPVSISLPVEVAALRPAPGAELAAMHCMTCHSAEYINTQPSLTRTAWKATVEKMRGKFGAPIPGEQVEKLADYLGTAYGKPETVK